jgi:uncharacterized membrane protein
MRTATLVPHLMAVVGFFLTHGSSAGLAFAARRERDPVRLARLLQLSSSSVSLLYGFLLLVLVLGVLNGFRGRYWDSWWIWLSILLLIAVEIIMYLLGTKHFARVRTLLEAGAGAVENGPEDQRQGLERLLSSSRPYLLAAVGFAGITLFLWLMVGKPF